MIAPMKQTTDFYLTYDERTSPVWMSVCAHIARMLDGKRNDLENPKLTEVETATLRGHIQCLKAVLALGKEPPPKVATDARPSPRTDLGAKYG